MIREQAKSLYERFCKLQDAEDVIVHFTGGPCVSQFGTGTIFHDEDKDKYFYEDSTYCNLDLEGFRVDVNDFKFYKEITHENKED